MYLSCAMKLFALGGAETSVAVGKLDLELLGALDYQCALAGRYGVGNLAGVLAVLHEQKVDFPGVTNQEFLCECE